jgi:hypothetical protein
MITKLIVGSWLTDERPRQPEQGDTQVRDCRLLHECGKARGPAGRLVIGHIVVEERGVPPLGDVPHVILAGSVIGIEGPSERVSALGGDEIAQRVAGSLAYSFQHCSHYLLCVSPLMKILLRLYQNQLLPVEATVQLAPL